MSVGWTAALTLIAATLAPAGYASSTEDQLGDGELYGKIASGENPLCGMSLDEASSSDPRRVEALVIQRIVRPFGLALGKLVRPFMDLGALDESLREAYIRRNQSLRASGRLTCDGLSEENASAWRANGRILVDTLSLGTPETQALVGLLRSNQGDIHRAFLECEEALSSLGPSWKKLLLVVSNMHDTIRRICGGASSEVVDTDLGLGSETNRFGAVSFDDAVAFGEFEHEAYIVSGHRAPAVGLGEYRRMGGRVF